MFKSWYDLFQQVKAEERKKTDEMVKTDQKLQNYLANGKLEKALCLSIRLDRPRQTRKTLELLKKRSRLENALNGLNLVIIYTLPLYVKWVIAHHKAF